MSTINVNEKIGTPTATDPAYTVIFANAHASTTPSAFFRVTRSTPVVVSTNALTDITIQIATEIITDSPTQWADLSVKDSSGTVAIVKISGSVGKVNAEPLTKPGFYRLVKAAAVAGSVTICY